jgi:acyl-[acyl-carrier-protein]-phospholipid O-acyltransferase/long-chain-fatty-acid--[acyl-carrier-protein] ligase
MSAAAELRPDPAMPETASPPVAKTRGFWALIATQFRGAFSDNVLRYLLLGIVVGPGLSEESGNRLVSVIMLLFSLPFILFSMSGGFLADRYSKRSVTIGTKFMEIGSMLIATLGLALHSLPLELAGLALVATQAALFGPSKYGLLFPNSSLKSVSPGAMASSNSVPS